MTSVMTVVKSTGPKLVPFLKSVAIYFVVFPANDQPTVFSTVLKCLPILSLMLFVLLHGVSLSDEHKYSRRILIGLIFCCVGDAFLNWPQFFQLGILAFAVGHLCYIVAFGFKPFRLPIGVVIYTLSFLGILYLLPGTEGFFMYAVPLYSLILSTMTWRAIARLNFRNWGRVFACAGAVLFAVSDLMLGINWFRLTLAYSQAFVMSTYYVAQVFIALSVVGERVKCD